jgi:hypothetical protein
MNQVFIQLVYSEISSFIFFDKGKKSWNEKLFFGTQKRKKWGLGCEAETGGKERVCKEREEGK